MIFFAILNEKLCIKNENICIKNDEFCSAAIADVGRATGCSGAHLRLPLSAPSDAALLNETQAVERFREQTNTGSTPSGLIPGKHVVDEPEPEPEGHRSVQSIGFSTKFIIFGLLLFGLNLACA